MQIMGVEDLVPGPHASQPHPEHTVYPCLLRGLTLSHSNLVWSAEFTFVSIPVDFMYPVAIIDWHSRYVPAWRLSSIIGTPLYLQAQDSALLPAQPCIFNMVSVVPAPAATSPTDCS
jgi:putative transposase